MRFRHFQNYIDNFQFHFITFFINIHVMKNVYDVETFAFKVLAKIYFAKTLNAKV